MTGLTDIDLREGFEAFIEASRRLEDSYSALKARAEAMDLQLAATNRRLGTALAEREALFAALPVGILAQRQGQTTFANPEAERLCQAGDALAIDLGGAGEGDLRVDQLSVRVRRVELPEDGSLVLLEDRSRLRHLEEEVHRLDKLAGLSELALGIAHEIKNPLNGALGFAELMQRATDSDTCRRHAARIGEGLRQVDAIVKALLAFARPEEAGCRTASVRVVIDEAASAAGLPAARLELDGAVDEATPADAVLRVLTNLFLNAVEASPEPEVAVSVRATGSQIEITVKDNGPGVSEELGARIFEPFVTTKDRGHGLGLALSARVLGYLGGSLELSNSGEPGACFVLKVPAVRGGAA